jgi:glucokinase
MSPRTVIGVDLGGTHMRAGRVEDGRVAAHGSRPTPAGEAAEIVVRDLEAAIAAVLAPGVEAIGVGVPSVVDVARGIVYDVENIPSWKEVPLRAALEARFGLPVQVNNDANCFALGEHRFGKGRGTPGLLGLVVGTGLGAGLVLNGRLHAGANCGAGEIGAAPYRDRTYEFYASGQRFRRDHGEDGAVLHARALRGDPAALEAFRAFGRDFGQVLVLALHAYDPGLIVLGGSVSRAWPLFKDAAWETLRGFAYRRTVETLAIEVSEDPHIAILGAAALCETTGPAAGPASRSACP